MEKLDSTYMVFVKFADTKFHHEVISRCQALLVKAAVAPLFVRRYEHDSEAGCTTTRINLIRSTFIAKPSSTRVFVFLSQSLFLSGRVFVLSSFHISAKILFTFAVQTPERLKLCRKSIIRTTEFDFASSTRPFKFRLYYAKPSSIREYKVRSLVREFTRLRCNLGRKSKAKFEDP